MPPVRGGEAGDLQRQRQGRVRALRHRLALALLAALAAAPAAARDLVVGPAEALRAPSAAAAIAQPGDRILIRAGTYADCASWRVADLRIEAADGPVVITGPVCRSRGHFVIDGSNVTVTGLTFRGARGPGGNGAGIYAPGGDVTVRRSRFEDNENGVITAGTAGATLVVEESVFIGNGALRDGADCAHAIYAGRIGRAVVRNSHFENSRPCHHVKSRAARTEVTDSVILDTPDGQGSSYLIDIPNGGDVVIRGNRLVKGPRSGNPTTAIALGFEGVTNPTRSLLIERNRFENRMPGETAFVVNRTQAPALLQANRLTGPVVPLRGPGEVRR